MAEKASQVMLAEKWTEKTVIFLYQKTLIFQLELK